MRETERELLEDMDQQITELKNDINSNKTVIVLNIIFIIWGLVFVPMTIRADNTILTIAYIVAMCISSFIIGDKRYDSKVSKYFIKKIKEQRVLIVKMTEECVEFSFDELE